MPKYFTISLFFLLIIFSACQNKPKNENQFTGSESCIECHANFYKLWATSHHGLAMQPITASFIKHEISIGQEEIFMEQCYYSAIVKDTSLFIRERTGDKIKTYKVLWALGGKNVYYFLTDFEGGRLQTLPLAFNVNTHLWYNNPESAVRHFTSTHQSTITDEALSWKHQQYTFNTSCYSCHVSQLSNNYNIETNTYQTKWKETGINCETCHGPAQEHVKAARLAEKKGTSLVDPKLIVTSTFTAEQHNASCGSCHAKMRAITPSYMPGDKFFDNYDLITLENNDFYPDGRDLGENYTMTGWHMNECAKASEMHCVTCHTSSGRYRFKSDDLQTANRACTSCHNEKEAEYEAHTHHSFSSIAPKCIDCHMPMTSFGQMNRSDHSFRPPMPKASMEFGSPNACNICHDNKNAEWSQKQLDVWGKDKGYQQKTLEAGRLIIAAREGNWNQIDKMKTAIINNSYGEVFTTSLLRLMITCPDPTKREAAIKALTFDSPLIRSAAAHALAGLNDNKTKKALLNAAQDSVLVVRLYAATSLSFFPVESFLPEENEIYQKVNQEYIQSLVTRPDDWNSHYNLGNHFQNNGEIDKALASYETASKINSEVILPLVNSSLLYSIQGNQMRSKEKLELALKIEPNNEAANFNYALLMAEMQNFEKAEETLRKVIGLNENNAAAAYNLAVLVANKNLNEACKFSQMAYKAQPDEVKYGYTFAYYLFQNKNREEAIKVLNNLIIKYPKNEELNSLLIHIKNQVN